MSLSRFTALKAAIIPAFFIVTGLLIAGYGMRFPEFDDRDWEQPFHESGWTSRLDAAAQAAGQDRSQAFNAMSDEWYAARAKP